MPPCNHPSRRACDADMDRVPGFPQGEPGTQLLRGRAGSPKKENPNREASQPMRRELDDETTSGRRVKLTLEERRRAVAEYAAQGLSQRRMAKALSVSRKTIQDDLAGLGIDTRTVTGDDGKRYQARGRRTIVWADRQRITEADGTVVEEVTIRTRRANDRTVKPVGPGGFSEVASRRPLERATRPTRAPRQAATRRYATPTPVLAGTGPPDADDRPRQPSGTRRVLTADQRRALITAIDAAKRSRLDNVAVAA